MKRPTHGSIETTRTRRAREAKEKRAERLARAVAGLAGQLARHPRWLRRWLLMRAARQAIRELLGLGPPGAHRLADLLLAVGVRELWVGVWEALGSAHSAVANGPLLRASVLQQVCERGQNRRVRVWALREMQAALADSPQRWTIAVPALVDCARDKDQEIAQAAAEVLAPLRTADAIWARELLVDSIETSTDREVLLFAVPITDRFLDSTSVRRAIDALFHCYESTLDTEVRAALEHALRVQRGAHPGEYEESEAEYASRAGAWIDRQILSDS